MRSQNVGIVGLALLGVAFVAPQQASAYASYTVDVDTTTTASLSGTGSIRIQNYYSGVSAGGYYVDAGGGSSTLSEQANSTSGSGSGSVSGEFDIMLSGVATNFEQARAYQRSNEGRTLQTINGTTTLGTVITVTGLTASTDLSLDMTLDYLLGTADSGGNNTYAGAYWFVSYQTRAAGTSSWSNWSPNCGATSYFCGQTPFGASNTGDYMLSYETAGPAGYRADSGSASYDVTAGLAASTDYRFRLSLGLRGNADSLSGAEPPASPVPLPAALPMLGAAMAGLGLFAARRRNS